MPFINPLADYSKNECDSIEHDPPDAMVLKYGYHTWRCPKCGKEQVVVQRIP